jgi:cytoskeleton protein RodZ
MFELGNNLREARQHRRIDLVIAEQDTKIRSKYLAALETEDFDVLPGPVFVRGFLRTYSRYLGLDPQLFIEEYNARFGRFEEVDDHHTPSLGRPGLAQAREQRGRRTMRVLIIATLVAVAGLAWLGLHQSEHTTTAGADATPAVRVPSTTTQATAPNSLGAAVTAAGGTGTAGAAAKPMTPYAKAAAKYRAKRAAAQARARAQAQAKLATADATDAAAR